MAYKIGKTIPGQVAVNCDTCGKGLYTGDEYAFSARPPREADFPYCDWTTVTVCHIILCAKCATLPEEAR